MAECDFYIPIYQIGVVKKKTGLTGRQIRYYEQIGLIDPPDRTDNNYRIYSKADVEKLKEIKKMMDQGLSTSGILKKFEFNKQNN